MNTGPVVSFAASVLMVVCGPRVHGITGQAVARPVSGSLPRQDQDSRRVIRDRLLTVKYLCWLFLKRDDRHSAGSLTAFEEPQHLMATDGELALPAGL